MDCDYFKNPFKVCSDEWADRSLINSIIWTSTSRLNSVKEDIDDYCAEIKKSKEMGWCPGIRYEYMEQLISRRTNELFKIKQELGILKKEGMDDKKKLEMYWEVHDRI